MDAGPERRIRLALASLVSKQRRWGSNGTKEKITSFVLPIGRGMSRDPGSHEAKQVSYQRAGVGYPRIRLNVISEYGFVNIKSR